MTRSFAQFDARIAEASDEASLRAVLGEVGLWRAQRLMDIPAQRQAAYALSVVYDKLGERTQAVHEAEQLVALCKTPPAASHAEEQVADRHLARMVRAAGGEPKPARSERAPRGERTPRAERGGAEEPRKGGQVGDGWEKALALASEGKWAAATEALPTQKGVRHALFLVWADLAGALALQGKARDAALNAVRDRLAETVIGRRSQAEPGARRGAPESALELLIGAALPRDRDGYVDALNAFVEAHPERADEVAALALREHVQFSGARKPAPWLFGLTAIALARGAAPNTTAALAELGEIGAYAVTAYQEPQFAALVEVLREALAAGAGVRNVRRGVLRQEEPDDRRLWTMRLTLGGGELMVASAVALDEPYSEELAATLARRVAELDPAAVVIAPGAGHSGFRASAMALGLTASETVDIDGVLHRLRGRAAAAPRGAAARAPKAAAEPKPVAERGEGKASPVRAVTRLFTSEPAPEAAAYVGPLSELRWVGAAFPAVRRLLQRMEPAEADRRFATLLEATHTALGDERSVPEATTVALRIAAQVPEGEVSRLLGEGGPLAARFGGEGFGVVSQIARALTNERQRVDRVLHGITRREAREHEALAALGDDSGGLWRLVVRAGDARVEVWWLGALTAEGRAMVPLLALQVPDAVVAVPADGEVADWYAAAGLGAPVVWDGGPALADAVAAAVAVAPAGGGSDEAESSDDPTAEA